MGKKLVLAIGGLWLAACDGGAQPEATEGLASKSSALVTSSIAPINRVSVPTEGGTNTVTSLPASLFQLDLP